MPPYFQLVHLSDLHFGDHFCVPSPCLPGLHTHDYVAAVALSDSVKTKLTSGVACAFIATGDLTTWGTPAAFQLAHDFLRSEVPLGLVRYGFNAPGVSVLPGNHDLWGGSLLGVAAAPNLPLARATFLNHFDPPAPAGDYVSEVRPGASPIRKPFPYRVRFDGTDPVIYLYGLDSTRLDAYPARRLNSSLAYGFTDGEQMERLESLVRTEPDDSDVPRIRIAALHHPLAYPAGSMTPVTKTLIGRDKVIRKLQELGFALALCGHQHKGFTRAVQAEQQYEPIQVFSVGTCTQAQCLPSQLPVASPRNEYCIYEFEAPPSALPRLHVTVRRFIYDPNLFAFAENKYAGPQLRLDLSKFP